MALSAAQLDPTYEFKKMLEGLDKNTVLKMNWEETEERISTGSYKLSVKVRKAALEHVCRVLNVQLSSLIYAVWGMLLQRYMNSHDVVFSALNGKTGSVLPMRIASDSGFTLGDLIKNTDQLRKEREPFTGKSTRDMMAACGWDKESIWNTALMVTNSLDEIRDALSSQQSEYDLILLFHIGDTMKIKVRYNERAFHSAAIEQLYNHFENVLLACVKKPQLEVRQVRLLNEKELTELQGFNRTEAAFSTNQTIHRLFEQQARMTPNQTAIVFGKESITYAELNVQAERLARRLLIHQVSNGSVVAMMMEPSLQMMIGILGILKAGAAYLPIDPAFPLERISNILKDSRTHWLMAQHDVVNRLLLPFEGKILSVADELEAAANEELPVKLPDSHPTDLAYILYTFDSTDKPKGVMVAHRSLINLAEWHREYFQITSEDKAAQYAGSGFDTHAWEIIPYLIAGATIHIIPGDIRLETIRLNEYFHEHGITVSFLPTPFCEQFMKLENHSLRVLLTSGEKLKSFEKRSYQLFNCYGSVENTMVTTCYPVKQLSSNIPIGFPIANSRIYILDCFDQPQQIGAVGELCISGDGLARGYWNRLDLTETKFVPNPFEPGNSMYRTGDLVRWLPDGVIQFYEG